MEETLRAKIRSSFHLVWFFFFSVSGCSVDSARSHYILAEKLWNDKSYSAAVAEFEKVISKDPKGKLGMQAMYRAATTQALFLSEYVDAVRKFRLYSQGPVEPDSAWEAKVQVGDILFMKTEQYDQTLQHYEGLLKERPDCREAPEFHFRIAKSWFYLLRFNEAVKKYQEIIQKYPLSSWAERAAYEIGVTYFTKSEQQAEKDSPSADPYQNALTAYRDFVKKYPNSPMVAEAQFGIAGCLEEKGQLDSAYEIYSSLKKTYPAPGVIDIKLSRLKERVAHRGGMR